MIVRRIVPGTGSYVDRAKRIATAAYVGQGVHDPWISPQHRMKRDARTAGDD